VKATPDAFSSTSLTHSNEAILYAALSGAHVINCSYGGSGFSNTEQAVVNFAASRGTMVIASAGNGGSESINYPCGYANVICVANTTSSDAKNSSSQYGYWVDISAPGSGIYGTVPYTGYASYSGTSASAPLVAGLCGLMLSANSSLTSAEIESCLKSTATNIDAQNPNYIGKLGAGRINAYAAVQCAILTTGATPPVAAFTNAINSCTGLVHFRDSSLNRPNTWLWDFGDGNTSALRNPDYTYITNGVYTVKLKVSNSIGADSVEKTGLVTIAKPDAPATVSDSRCGNGSLSLSATGSGGDLNWFETTTGGTSLNTGNSFNTPVLSSSKTYYVEEIIKFPSQNFGAFDTTIGTGAFFTANSDRRMYFDVISPVHIKSAKVYAGSAGNRRIEVRTSVGVLVTSTVVNIPLGESRIDLNLFVPIGTNYCIKVSGQPVDLYRNNAGSVFPYTVSGLINITGTDAGSPGYWYFFYDMEVAEAPCISQRAEVQATILLTTPVITLNGNVLTSTPATTYQWYLDGSPIPGATQQSYTMVQSGAYTVEVTGNGCTLMSDPFIFVGTEVIAQKDLIIYPNPVSKQLVLANLPSQSAIEIFDVLGNRISAGQQEIHNELIIDVSRLSPGVYFLKLHSGQGTMVRKFVRE
jgi:PKD repeat protein